MHTCPTKGVEFDKTCTECWDDKAKADEERDLSMTFWEPDLWRRKPSLSELDGDPL